MSPRLPAALWRALLDVAFPRACAACGGPVGHEAQHVCWSCLGRLDLIQAPYCELCGDPYDGAIQHEFRCAFCVDHRPRFERARSAARYRGPLRPLLHAFKYDGASHLAPDLANLLHACVQVHYGSERFDAVTCVPLHPVKERSRTYNQAHLLAAELARRMGLPLLPRCLQRVRATATQTHLSAAARTRNVRNAFAAAQPQWIQGRCLLLVDDVMTTGATVAEAARALRSAGAARVFVATVGRG
jgi:ComF family protein